MLRKISGAVAVAAVLGAMAAPIAQASNDPYMAPLFANGVGALGCSGLYNNEAGQPPETPAGFTTVVPQGDGTVQIDVHLRNADPNTTYLFTDACVPNNVGYLTTNSAGVGNGSLISPQNGQTVWVINGGPVNNVLDPVFYFASSVIVFPPSGS